MGNERKWNVFSVLYNKFREFCVFELEMGLSGYFAIMVRVWNLNVNYETTSYSDLESIRFLWFYLFAFSDVHGDHILCICQRGGNQR